MARATVPRNVAAEGNRARASGKAGDPASGLRIKIETLRMWRRVYLRMKAADPNDIGDWPFRAEHKVYNPDQPRVEAGRPDGGQWVGNNARSGIVVAGGFEPQHMDMTVQQFMSAYCIGGIKGQVPGQFLDFTIRDLLDAEKRGVPGAHTCYKLLSRDRFRK
jgi:hypothetical protein